MSFDPVSRPNILPWPPIILLVTTVVALILGIAAPLPAIGGEVPRMLGWIMVAAGAVLDLWAALTMRRAKTNILPHRGADVLVTWGPFRFSRNPIYVANTVLLFGAGLAFANYWLIVCMIVADVLVDRLAIRREEIHLAARFGQSWSDYAARTPRWLV